MRIIKIALAVVLLLASHAAIALDAASIPSRFPIPWANSASATYVNAIPEASQIGITNCAASLTDGFPPLTFTPASSGGCPPFGKDFNGILKQITQWSQWQAAGNPVLYNASFSSSIGGYPKGSMLGQAATNGCFWISSVDNNTSNPDSGGANWISGCLGSMQVGITTILSGTSGRILYQNGSVLGQLSTSGTGNVVLSSGSTITSGSFASPTITGTFTATGLVKNADLVNAATTVNGQTCTLGSTCTITASAGTITVGVTAVASGSAGCILFNNSSLLGCSTGPSMTSPVISGTVTGGASYSGITATSPTISGTVAGGATYTSITATSPTISGTVGGAATYTSITLSGPTINTATIASPSITGTVAGGATYSSITLSTPTMSSPTVTGTVAGSATYSTVTLSSPTLSGTVAGSVTISGTITASGAWTHSGTVNLTSALFLNSTITPITLAANTDNWNPTSLATSNSIRVQASSAVNVTGIVAPATNGGVLVIQNVGSNSITFTPDNGSTSTAANRFLMPAPFVLVPNGSVTIWYDVTSARWRPVQTPLQAAMQGGYSQLKIDVTSTVVATITANALSLTDANGSSVSVQTVSKTVNITTSGAGGLDSGSRAANTWYYVWAIYNPTTRDVAGLASTSSSSPTLPSGYTFRARIGAVRTDANGTPLLIPTVQYGRIVQYKVDGATLTKIPLIATGPSGTMSGTSPSLVNVAISNFAPTTAARISINANNTTGASSACAMLVAPNTAWGGTNNGPDGSNNVQWPLYANTTIDTNINIWLTLESANISWASEDSECTLGAMGWEDNI